MTKQSNKKAGGSYRFNAMTNARNELSQPSLFIHELHWTQTLVYGIRKVLCSTVQRTTKSITLKRNSALSKLIHIY
jgi:hypothetical protein